MKWLCLWVGLGLTIIMFEAVCVTCVVEQSRKVLNTVAEMMVEAVASEVVVDVATVVDADDERSKTESQ